MAFEEAGRRGHRRTGSARVSTEERSLDLRLDVIERAGGKRVVTDKASAVNGDRPGLAAAVSDLRSVDFLMIWKAHRLGRTVKGRVEFAAGPRERAVRFRSMTDRIDTTTPAGRFFFHVMASLDEHSRSSRQSSRSGKGRCHE
jgi:DNA invertase Pin-like site-specific DNA recombinase